MRNRDKVPALGQPEDTGKGVLPPEETPVQPQTGSLNGFLSSFNAHGMQSQPGHAKNKIVLESTWVKYLESFEVGGQVFYRYHDRNSRVFHSTYPIHGSNKEGLWFEYLGTPVSQLDHEAKGLVGVSKPALPQVLAHEPEPPAPKHRGIVLRPKAD